jgi:small-conductance mechanosensitive channel
MRRRLQHAGWTLLFLTVLAGSVYEANHSLSAAAFVAAIGLGVSPIFASTIQSVLAGIQVRQEGIIRVGSIILIAAADGVRAGEVVSIRWRIVEVRCKDNAIIPVPNSVLTGSSPVVLADWPAPPIPPTS